MTSWGGARTGAGRKPEFNEPVTKVRIPTSLLPAFRAWLEKMVNKTKEK